MKVAGLFAGIGGLELGFSAAGHEAVIFSEISEPARAVLKARFPRVELGPAVQEISLPSGVEVLTAGFPCQDLSQAGLTAGIDGARSGLVSHVFRLMDKSKIPVIVIENVSFMLSLHGGEALRRIVEAFEERGYRWAYRVINSLAFLPQRRERVYLVASKCDLDPSEVLFGSDVTPPETQTSVTTHAHGFYWTEGVRGLGWAPESIPTLKNGSTIGIASPPAILFADGRLVTPDISDAERLQGFRANWTKPAEEVARPSARWSLVGNAVSIPVATWVARQMSKPKAYRKSLDGDLGKRWPRAARYDGTRRHAVNVGTFPVWASRLPLDEFLRYPGKPLSERATAGFLSRAERSKLRFPEGFITRLEEHLERMRQRDEVAQKGLGSVAIAAE